MLSVSAGCSFCQTKRGHLIRCEWAIEHNRVPWIGCPPTSGYDNDDDGEDDGKSCGLMKRLKNGKKRFRWHCGLRSECTSQQPCCKTLGCGMMVDPDDPQGLTQLGGGAKACGLTPFCTPMKPCGLTPNCGKPVQMTFNPQMLAATYPAGANPVGGNLAGGNPMGSHPAAIRSGNPFNPFIGGMNGMNGAAPAVNSAVNSAMNPAAQRPAMQGALVSKGIVPGVSTVSTGGVVAAIGVATPGGTMTAAGVQLPNGVVNPNIVMRACTLSPNCTAAHPCGLVPGCGMSVPLAAVSNNATVLASALMAQGSASGVMQAGTMVNPVTNQPVSGLTMNGYPQAGYPPIGYSPTGYSPGYPRFDGNAPVNEEEAEEPSAEEEAIAERQSKMPVPRFYPVPSKPAFQRSEGLQKTPNTRRNQSTGIQNTGSQGADNTGQKTGSREQIAAMSSGVMSDEELDAALDEAYLQGVSAAMNEVEREMMLQRMAADKKNLQMQIAQQTQMIQEQITLQNQIASQQTDNVTELLPARRHEAYLPRSGEPAPISSITSAAPLTAAVRPSFENSLAGIFKSAFSGVNHFLTLKQEPAVSGQIPPAGKQNTAVVRNVPVTKNNTSKSSVAQKQSAANKQYAAVSPAKPAAYKDKMPMGLEPESEPVSLVQQAQYEREIPRP
jgi:hypothetical protein